MRTLFVFLLASQSAFAGQSKAMDKLDRLERQLNQVQALLSQYVQRENQDRKNLEAKDKCFKDCEVLDDQRTNYKDNPALISCHKACSDLPAPPGGC